MHAIVNHSTTCTIASTAPLQPQFTTTEDVLSQAQVSQFLLLAGRILLECGAETSRIEETMARMGRACGMQSVHTFCTPTGILLTLVAPSEDILTRVITVDQRGIDLGKVAEVNDISRLLEAGRVSPTQAFRLLPGIASRACGYPFPWNWFARGISSACWALLLGGTWLDFFPSMIAGFLVQATYDRLRSFLPDFLAIFFCALIGTLWALVASNTGFGEHLGSVVVGVIVPLVPGMALTNAIRDLIAGDLLSGVSRGAEALLVAVAIAGGVSTVLASLKWTVWI